MTIGWVSELSMAVWARAVSLTPVMGMTSYRVVTPGEVIRRTSVCPASTGEMGGTDTPVWRQRGESVGSKVRGGACW